ncbi:hypothetical protein D3C83_140550 [compost metagenome]
MPVLTATARLTDELALRFCLLADSFAIGYLRLAHVGADAKLTEHAVHQDLEVKFAHTRNDGLTGVLIGCDFEGGVLLRQLAQRHR